MIKAELITPVRYNGVKYTPGEGEFPNELVQTRPELFGIEEKQEKKTSTATPTKGAESSKPGTSKDSKGAESSKSNSSSDSKSSSKGNGGK